MTSSQGNLTNLWIGEATPYMEKGHGIPSLIWNWLEVGINIEVVRTTFPKSSISKVIEPWGR